MSDIPLWSDLYCLNHQQKIEYVDISRGSQANRIFCSSIQCNRPIDALDFDKTKLFTQNAIESYEIQIKEIQRIIKLGEQEIRNYEMFIQNTQRMIDNVYRILNENCKIQQDLKQNITSLNQLQKFCQSLYESKQNIAQQQDYQNINLCLQSYMNDKKHLKKKMKPISVQFSEQKIILQNQSQLNSFLLKNPEMQILSKSILQDSMLLGQQNTILCPQHHEEVKLISLNTFDQRRAICFNCLDGAMRNTSQIQQVLQNHENEYKKIQTQVLSGEDFYQSLIKKSFLQIVNILKQILNNFDEKVQQLDEIWLDTEKKLHEDDQIFNIQNYEQLEHLAKLHYKIFQSYYSNQQNYQMKINYKNEFLTSLYSKIQPQSESIAKISDDLIVQIKLLFQQFQQSLQFMQKTVQSKLMQQQVSNSVVTNFQSSKEIKKILFDENNMTIILQQTNTVMLLQQEKDKFVLKTQQQFRYCLKDICFQNQGKWFVTGSEGSISELKFWSFSQLEQGRVEIKFEEQSLVKEILQLEVDHKNNNCVSFHQDEVNIWKKNKNWEQINKISSTDTLLLAQFDQTSSHLAVLFTNTLQIIIFNQNQLVDEQKKIFDFQFQEIKNSSIKIFTFFQMKQVKNECQQLLFHYDQKVALLNFDRNSKKGQIIKLFTFPEQSINFLSFNNFISIIDKDNEVYSLYQIVYNERNQDFNLILITQIISRQGFSNSVLSSNGKLLAVVTDSVDNFELNIQQLSFMYIFSAYIKMPHLNKIPTKQLNFQFSDFPQ